VIQSGVGRVSASGIDQVGGKMVVISKWAVCVSEARKNFVRSIGRIKSIIAVNIRVVAVCNVAEVAQDIDIIEGIVFQCDAIVDIIVQADMPSLNKLL